MEFSENCVHFIDIYLNEMHSSEFIACGQYTKSSRIYVRAVRTEHTMRIEHWSEHYTTQVSQPFEYLSNALHHKYCPNRTEIAVAILSTDWHFVFVSWMSFGAAIFSCIHFMVSVFIPDECACKHIHIFRQRSKIYGFIGRQISSYLNGAYSANIYNLLNKWSAF